jgi:membrane protease YdiL (CAAX protease family)
VGWIWKASERLPSVKFVRKRLWKPLWALLAIEVALATVFFALAPRQVLLQPQNLIYVTGGVVLVFLLALFQKHRLPFPYSAKLTLTEHSAWTVAPFLEMVGVWFLLGLLRVFYYRCNGFYCAVNPSALYAACLSSITEESLKVIMTNFFALILGRLRKYRFIRVNRILIAGVASVIIWTLGHIPYQQYGSIELVAIFISGMIMFYVIYRKRTIFPAIYIHLLWNAFFS